MERTNMVTWHSVVAVDRGREWDIFQYKKKHCDIRCDAAEVHSCISSQQKWRRRGSQNPWKNIALEIIENPQTEVTSGETKPLHKRWQSDDSESSCCNGIKPAKTRNIHRRASWKESTCEVKHFFCHISTWSFSKSSFWEYCLNILC